MSVEVYGEQIRSSLAETLEKSTWRPEIGDAIASETFLGRIRDAFPELSWKKYRRVQDGSDHVMFLLDNGLVFRFVRGNEIEDIAKHLRERAVLDAIQGFFATAIPTYTYIPDSLDFAGYKAVRGTRLSPWRFRRISQARRADLARELGEFLGAVHSFPVSRATALGVEEETPLHPNEPKALVEWFERRADVIPPDLRSVCERWLPEIEVRQRPYDAMFIHDDMWHKHVYHDAAVGRLTGIIDWGDVSIMDPAKDFYGFWSYGEQFVDSTLKHYPRSDSDLKKRSLTHFKTIVLRCLCYPDEERKGFRYGREILGDNCER